MKEILTKLLQAILAVAVPILTAFGDRDRCKAHHKHQRRRHNRVAHLSQTYVDELKKSKNFSKENQE